MSRLFQVHDMRDAYVDNVNAVLRDGERASPRGFETREVRGATIEVDNTSKLLPYGVERRLKPEIGYAEALLLCGGLQSPSLLTAVSPAFKRFMDGGALAGAYGPRVRHQMEHAIKQLRSDADSRQAIVQVYDPRHDQLPVRDVSCTLGFGFHLRDDELHMHSTMRSQDVWLGMAYDFFMFGQLGHTVANVLDVRFASLTHHVYSLHIYSRNFDAAAGLMYSADLNHAAHREPRGFDAGAGTETYEDARRRAEDIYNGILPIDTTAGERDYYDRLNAYDYQRGTASFIS